MPRSALLVSLLLAAPAPAAEPPTGKPNRLAREVSPYLRMHARNPIDWYPWGPEALAKAKKEGKLIFLSVGYSACHWCHVMERESFNDPAIAAVLNKSFVCIKVDREERPDVDEVYITAMQLVGEESGYPLSVFLTPDAKPIFGGTYFPPEDKTVGDGKVPGFKSVLKRVLDLNAEKPEELREQADKVAKATADLFNRSARMAALVPLNRDQVEETEAAFALDPEHGGIGARSRNFAGPKFPRAPALAFLLHRSAKAGHTTLRRELAVTFERMAAGGVYDHLGGGFHRYATERTWTVPHFEKMLYDQAQLAELYAAAYRADPRPAYRRTVVGTLEFVARELTSPDGAFYAALDADADGRDGAYYLWSKDDLDAALGSGADAKLFRQVYGLDEPSFDGKQFILHQPKPLAEQAKDRGVSEDDLAARLAPLQAKLLAVREKRPKPFRDEKVLTGWNGLMIAGYARAGGALKEPRYVAAAERAADYLLSWHRDKDGRLMRMSVARPGEVPEVRGPAFLEDYAFLLHGLLALHEATGQARWLDEAKKLVEQMTKWHGDPGRGGFFTAAGDQDRLFVRVKDSEDGATPTGNGTAARCLIRLWAATKEPNYREAAEATVQALASVLRSAPGAAPTAADALDLLLDAPR